MSAGAYHALTTLWPALAIVYTLENVYLPPSKHMQSDAGVRRNKLMNRPTAQEHHVAFRITSIFACVTFGVLFNGSVMGKAKVGDWEFGVESDGTAVERRVAFTSAHPYSGSKPRPKLVIRRMKPDSPAELMITATHDEKKDKCDYRDWKIMIDGTGVPVLGYTFEPAKTELKAKLGTPKDELWNLFRKGLKLTVQVEQKCDSFSGASDIVSYTFSLRGSSAAYKFVLRSTE